MPKYPSWVVGLLVVPFLAVGCGSDHTNSKSAGGSAPATESSVVAQAKAELAKYAKTPTKIPVTEPITTSPKGKTIVYAEPAIPVAKTIGQRIDEAAAALGMNVRRVNIGTTPDKIVAGMSEAVRARPDAVIVVAFDPTFWKTQAAALKAAGVPTIVLGGISCNLRDPCKPGEVGTSVNFASKYEAEWFARLQADKIIADSNGKANAVYFGDPQLGNSNILAKEFTLRMNKCGGCSVATVSAPITGVGTKFPSQVVSYLQSHPKVRYVSVQYGDFLIGVPQALKAAGLTDVKLTTQASSAPQFKDIKSGGAQIADVPVPYGYLAFQSVDTVARLLGKQDIPTDQLKQPLLVMTKDNLDVSDSSYWPGVTGYRDQFEGLWKRTGG